MKVAGVVALVLWSFLSIGQEVHVSRGNHDVVLTVWAQKPYPLMSGEEKMPTLSLECIRKGKKPLHLVKFSAGGSLVEDSPALTAKGEELIFNMTIGGSKQMTTWVPYGDVITFTYFGKSEAERLKFLQSLLSSGSVSIEFKPFLTGVPTTSVFDLSKLRDEMAKYPECTAQ